MRYRILRRAIPATVLLIGGVVVWNLPVGNRETGTFVFKPLQNAEIRAPVEAFVAKVHYDEGDEAAEGAVIAEMEVPELNSDIAGKRSEIEEVRAQLRSLGADAKADRPNPVGQDRATSTQHKSDGGRDDDETLPARGSPRGKVHEVEAEMEYARQRYEQSRTLNRTKVVSDDKLREMKKDYQVWQTKYQEVLSEQEAAKAQLARLIEELTYLEEVKARLVLRSPIRGIVTTPRARKLEGHYFEEGDLILEVVNPDELEAEVTIGEQNMSLVAPGQRVELKPFSLPYRTVDASVLRIAPVVLQPDEEEHTGTVPQGSSGELKVYCSLGGAVDELTPGMSGYARIYLADETFGNLVASRLMRFIRTEFWW